MWSTTDFVLKGRFCPVEEIGETLARIGRQTKAGCAILVVADERAVLRTLCATWSRSSSSADLTDLVARVSSVRGDRPRLQDLVRTGRSATRSLERFPRSAGLIVENLRQRAQDEGLDAAARFDVGTTWVPVQLPAGTMDARVSCAVLLQNPQRHVVSSRSDGKTEAIDSSLFVVVDAAMRQLLEQVNGTAHASVRRDGYVMTRLDETVSPSEIVLGTINFEDAAVLLTRLAVEVSHSHIGACYVREPQHKRLRCVAAYVPPQFKSFVSYKRYIPAGSRRAAARSVVEHGRVFYHRALGDSDGPVETTFDKEVELSPAELATPIPGPLVSKQTPAVGVLTVAKLEDVEDDGHFSFGAYDHAVLRNIALRLALLRATTHVEEAGTILASLPIATYTATGGIPRARGARSRPVSQHAQWLLREFKTVIPDDLDIAIPAITGGLERLAMATTSHSATFRAALPNSVTRATHGLVLVRIAASSVESLNARGPVQHEADGGLNWVAVRTGRPRYSPNVGDEAVYFACRPDTVSQLSMPVVVEGRVIGVVNLESPLKHGYDGQIATAQAFAERIALIIANARLAVTRQAQEYATKIIGRGHEVAEQCKQLREMPGFDPHTRRDVTVLANNIESKARGLRAFTPEAEKKPSAATLPAIVDDSIAAAQATAVEVKRSSAAVWSAHPGDVAEALRECCYHIVMNVKRHAPVEGGFRASGIRLYQDEWGGQIHDIMVVRNVSDEGIDARTAVNLYRAPIERILSEGDGETAELVVPHFGAYLAGTLARLTGGDVYLSAHRGRDVRLTLAVPTGRLD